MNVARSPGELETRSRAVAGGNGIDQRLTEELVDHLLRLSGSGDALADEVMRVLGDADEPPGPAPPRAG